MGDDSISTVYAGELQGISWLYRSPKRIETEATPERKFQYTQTTKQLLGRWRGLEANLGYTFSKILHSEYRNYEHKV
jgi:hypothetical protein